MAAPKNLLKSAMAQGNHLRGPFLSLGAETVAEIGGLAGFDFCLIDGEHGAFDPTCMRRQLMALAAVGMPAAVRVPMRADWVLKQALDLGAQTVMVPIINSVAEAQAAVRACRFPPAGIRGLGGANMRAGGYGATDAYAATANDEICVLLQVESRAGIEAIDQICRVEGVDCIFIGPADLACDMGHNANIGAPEVDAAVCDAIARIKSGGGIAGVFAGPDKLPVYREAGATVFGVGSDASALTQAFALLAEATA